MRDNIFETLYKQMNPKQREAVDAVEAPVMVIAGPGTGKTTVLTLWLANILRKTDTRRQTLSCVSSIYGKV